MNSLGWLGGILLAICGFFEAYRAVKSKEYSISVPFVISWFTGEVLTLIPLVVEKNEPYLIMNYSMNIVFILVIIGRLVKDKLKSHIKEEYKPVIEKDKKFRLCYRPERKDNG